MPNVRTVPVIVTMSSKLDMLVAEDTTAQDVKDSIMEALGVTGIESPDSFVVVADMLLGDCSICDDSCKVATKLRDERSVIRVAFPLKEKGV